MNTLSVRFGSSFLSRGLSYQLSKQFCTGTQVREDIDKLVKKSKVVVFMKGNPVQPKCGFSNAVVQILRMHGVTYDAHDVLQSDDLRNGKWMRANLIRTMHDSVK